VTPRIGITLGDAAGIGAEVILKALGERAVARVLSPLVIGDLETLREAAQRLELTCRFVPTGETEVLAGIATDAGPSRQGRPGPGRSNAGRSGAGCIIPVLGVGTLSARARRPGRPTIEGGRASYRYIETAARLATRGAIGGIVTGPINKAWVTRAGFPISGHTELLRCLTGARDVRMMLAGERLRVVLVTMHVALDTVPRTLTARDVTRTIVITGQHLRRYHGLAKPRLAVAGLNPHAGEGGLFGQEERTAIAPAIRKACQLGIAASGPFPADSVFFRAVQGEFDAVIAMYHDQGLIPLKLLHFHDAVNVSMGLPIVRTSPDHGTAYEIAGRGVADAGSMVAALSMAARMAAADAAGRGDGTRRTRPAAAAGVRAVGNRQPARLAGSVRRRVTR
jgi:4-hydroxythreonine-4-phosphate dehydrogenase